MMNLIVLGRNGQPAKLLTVRPTHLALVVLIVLGLMSLAMAGGYMLARSVGVSGVSEQAAVAEDAAVWQKRYHQLEQVYEDARRQSQAQLDALTLRLGQLQARMARMEAVGERITESAGLDPKEFDFGEPPGVGGPEATGSLPQVTGDVHSLLNDIDALESTLSRREDQLELMDHVLASATLDHEQFVAGRPIHKGWLSSKYGYRIDPFTGKRAWHAGVDFAGKDGSDIVASAGGVVTWAGERYGYGLMVEINHGNGLSTRYAHAKALLVKKGDVVSKGQRIALMGSTGRSTGPHVHYEVWKNGRPINPHQFVYRAAR